VSARDPIDDFADALFSAARRERPDDGVRARALEAALAPRAATTGDSTSAGAPESSAAPIFGLARREPYWTALAAAAALVVLVGGSILFRGRSEPNLAIGPEHSSRRDHAPTEPSPVDTATEPAPSLEPVPPADEAPRARAPAHATRDGSAGHKVEAPPASLPDEIGALDRVRSALSSGDTAGAFRGLDEYEHVLHGTRLTAEATLLRIDALARAGREREASDLAARFVKDDPGSALADRARAFIRTGKAIGVDAGGLQK